MTIKDISSVKMSDNEYGQFVFIEDYTQESVTKYLSKEFLEIFVEESPLSRPTMKSSKKLKSTGQKKDLFKKSLTRK